MKRHNIQLAEIDRKHLQELLSRGNLPVRVQKRVLGLLELDRGKTYQAVCDILSRSYSTVYSWSKKYKEDGLSFLNDKPCSGRPIELDGKLKARITALACSSHLHIMKLIQVFVLMNDHVF